MAYNSKTFQNQTCSSLPPRPAFVGCHEEGHSFGWLFRHAVRNRRAFLGFLLGRLCFSWESMGFRAGFRARCHFDYAHSCHFHPVPSISCLPPSLWAWPQLGISCILLTSETPAPAPRCLHASHPFMIRMRKVSN